MRGYHSDTMTIGILGSDDRAVAIARLLRRAGHQLTFSDPPAGLDKAEMAAGALGDGAQADSAYNQALSCGALVLAMRWDDREAALAALGPVDDQIIIDATLPPVLDGDSGAEWLSHKLATRRVVKAFVKPIRQGEPIEVCSDDVQAKLAVAEMIHAAGYKALDGGPLAYARDLERSVAGPSQPVT